MGRSQEAFKAVAPNQTRRSKYESIQWYFDVL